MSFLPNGLNANRASASASLRHLQFLNIIGISIHPPVGKEEYKEYQEYNREESERRSTQLTSLHAKVNALYGILVKGQTPSDALSEHQKALTFNEAPHPEQKRPPPTYSCSMAPPQNQFPILFTIAGSGRHEILLVSSTITDYHSLSYQIADAALNSPNCVEFMSKYKKKSDTPDNVTEMKVKWCPTGRDPKLWPSETIITDDNVEAVLKMVEKSGVGRDVFDVKIEAPPKKEEK